MLSAGPASSCWELALCALTLPATARGVRNWAGADALLVLAARSGPRKPTKAPCILLVRSVVAALLELWHARWPDPNQVRPINWSNQYWLQGSQALSMKHETILHKKCFDTQYGLPMMENRDRAQSRQIGPLPAKVDRNSNTGMHASSMHCNGALSRASVYHTYI